MIEALEWRVHSTDDMPQEFAIAAQQQGAGCYAAQLLWQRGIRDAAQLPGFLYAQHYQPLSAATWRQVVEPTVTQLLATQLQTATQLQNPQSVIIWGDFDAAGIAATALLWEGLQQFFPVDRLAYVIPDRFSSPPTFDPSGSIVIHPRTIAKSMAKSIAKSFAEPFVNPLSEVTIAYKLIGALYQAVPEDPQRPVEDLLDLVAIGLIADRRELWGEHRYWAQRGIEKLQQTDRPGLVKLLELCKRSGDRPMDMGYGLAARIHAISQIQGDARFCVELLTSRDPVRCRQLAEATELANARCKALQRDVAQQVKARIAQLDLSTQRVIVLHDPQWSMGALGLVAMQMAQEYGRPMVLLTNGVEDTARGVVRSPEEMDLESLLQSQAHWLLNDFGQTRGMELSLPLKNVELFTQAINCHLRQQSFQEPRITADLTVTVMELGQDLFRQLKLLEPYGIGNSVPQLLIQNCWFDKVWHRNIEDWRGRKLRYIKTEFEIWDDGTKLGFPGVWWGHYRDEILPGRCDAIAELDFNTAKKRYELRLIALRPAQQTLPPAPIHLDWLLDWRGGMPPDQTDVLPLRQCPSRWEDLQSQLRLAVQTQQKLAIAYPPPRYESPLQTWQTLVGIAKYLSRTGQPATREQLMQQLELGDWALDLGLQALQQVGFEILPEASQMHLRAGAFNDAAAQEIIAQVLDVIQEEQFHRRYFYTVSLGTLQAIALQTVSR